MKRKFLVISLIVLSLISCTFVTRLFSPGTETPEINTNPTPEVLGGGNPEIINHPRPDLPLNIQPFTEAGCAGENLYVMDCAAGSPLRALGCDFLTVNSLSGG